MYADARSERGLRRSYATRSTDIGGGLANRVVSPWFWILTGICVAVLAYFTSALVWLVVFIILNARHIGPFTQTEDLIPVVILTTLVIWLVSMVGISRLVKANAAEAARRTLDRT